MHVLSRPRQLGTRAVGAGGARMFFLGGGERRGMPPARLAVDDENRAAIGVLSTILPRRLEGQQPVAAIAVEVEAASEDELMEGSAPTVGEDAAGAGAERATSTTAAAEAPPPRWGAGGRSRCCGTSARRSRRRGRTSFSSGPTAPGPPPRRRPPPPRRPHLPTPSSSSP